MSAATETPRADPHQEPDVAGVADVADQEQRKTRELLEQVGDVLSEFVVLPGERELAAISLWTLHTWAFHAAHATPYLLPISPEKRSGKTRLLEVLEVLVNTPWRVTSASEAAMFRKIEKDQPTLLLDEIDAIFSAHTDRTEALRAILDTGNRPGASVARCIGDGANQQVVDFPVYCPKVLAGIDSGALPDTIRDRAIEIRMRRKTDREQVARFRYRDVNQQTEILQYDLTNWAVANRAALEVAEPHLPVELHDRAAEAWEPLLAIADLAGGTWPDQARAAALALSGAEVEDASRCTQLLGAARAALNGHEALSTADLLERINQDDELSVGGWHDGHGLKPRDLARLLKPYGIRPRSVRLPDNTTPKGYRREQFTDAWQRYLPSPSPEPPQAQQPPQNGGD